MRIDGKSEFEAARRILWPENLRTCEGNQDR
jgi:hypothetical protein